MQEGTIASLTDKGYGFIKSGDGSKDLFFHSKELVGVEFDSLKAGDRVKFEVGEGPKGPHATQVTKV